MSTVKTDTKVRDTMKRTGMSLDELVEAIDDGESEELGIDKSVAAAIRRRATASKKNLTDTQKTTQTTDQAVQTVENNDTTGAQTVSNTSTELSSAQQQQAAIQQAVAQQQAQQQAAVQQAQQLQQAQQQQTAIQQAAALQQAQQQQAWAAAQAQQQAANKGSSTTITQAELNQLMRDLLGTRSTGDNSSDGGGDTQSTRRLEVSDVDALDPRDVSFDKVGGGPMSKEEAAQAVLDACDLNGVPDDPKIRQKWLNLMVPMGEAESGLDPDAGNGWDSNAHGETQQDGLPLNSSRGAWQTIPTTFAGYHVAGTSTSIYDPVASAAAAQRYMFDRYGMTPEGDNMEGFAADRGIDLNDGSGSGAYKGY